MTTITLTLPIAREFVLEINIGLTEIQIQYGEGTWTCLSVKGELIDQGVVAGGVGIAVD